MIARVDALVINDEEAQQRDQHGEPEEGVDDAEDRVELAVHAVHELALVEDLAGPGQPVERQDGSCNRC